jgi:hypothetical protein
MADDGSWYEKAAKSGWLGTKAKVSADAGKADWSNKKVETNAPVNQLDAMKRRQSKLGVTE